MRIALAQLNPVVGDVAGNLAMLEDALAKVASERPDLVVFPELFLVGYPPLDLLERGWFVDRAEKALDDVARTSKQYPQTGILVGGVVRTGRRTGKGLYNAALLYLAGRELVRQPKTLLPTYDVFDELRYFDPAPRLQPVRLAGETLGISVCEDVLRKGSRVPGFQGSRVRPLDPSTPRPLEPYPLDPIADLAGAGAEILVNISASPFEAGKDTLRFQLLQDHARRLRRPLVFVNQVGGNDELVFDGRSMAFDRQGQPIAVLEPFVERLAIVDTEAKGKADNFRPLDRVESVFQALVLGSRDYCRKCGFKQAVLGLSGGIDSAVAACVAAAALGPENVLGVTMPSEYSSPGSVGDSEKLARNLGVRFANIPITEVYRSYLPALAEQFADRKPDETEENIQARVRGNILMALSNKFGYLVIATGNKSELAVGYCTIYGDMSGGLAVLADVPKMMVYQLARHINREREVIPRSSIEKPPSAELRPNQTDQDTLPPYEILDEILARYVETGQSAEEIVAAGFEPRTVEWVVRAVRRNEYKRRQAAPGIKVTSKAFGIGRRMPIAAKY